MASVVIADAAATITTTTAAAADAVMNDILSVLRST